MLRSLALTLLVLAGGLVARQAAPREVSFPAPDGGVVYALEYGEGPRAVVLGHGGRFTKESWSEQAPVLQEAGFRVLAIDFRGRGKSRGGPGEGASDRGAHFDILAAVACRPARSPSRWSAPASEAGPLPGRPPSRRVKSTGSCCWPRPPINRRS